MANRNDYTITTLSSSIRQFDACTRNNAIVTPFGKATNTANNLKIRYDTPYIAGPLNPPETGSVYTPPVTNYAVPFSYYRFEVSSSTNVTQVLGQNEYTGSFDGGPVGTTQYGSGKTWFGYSSTYVFTGSYAVRFPGIGASSLGSWIDLGTPTERTEWDTLFSGSFTWSGWVYPEYSSLYSIRYNGTPLFGLNYTQDASGGGFYFALSQPGYTNGPFKIQSYGGGALVGGWSPSAGPAYWNGSSDDINLQQWNHLVIMVEGSNADAGTNRRIRAYINNTDLGLSLIHI